MDVILSSVLSDSQLIELIKRRVVSQFQDSDAHIDYDVIIALTIDRTFQELGVGEMVKEFLSHRKNQRRKSRRDVSKPSFSHTEPDQVHRQPSKRRSKKKTSKESRDFHYTSSNGDSFDPSQTQTLSRSSLGKHRAEMLKNKSSPKKEIDTIKSGSDRKSVV